jgi:hypothetical protein
MSTPGSSVYEIVTPQKRPRATASQRDAASEDKKKADHLKVYFHDHLAGAVMALELLGHLISETDDSRWRAQLKQLKKAIESDFTVLQKIVKDLKMEESALKKATAWVTEKASRLKFVLVSDGRGTVGLVQALEVLSLGIAGKLGLWEMLRAVRPAGISKLPINLAELAARAKEQRKTVEGWRLDASRAAF